MKNFSKLHQKITILPRIKIQKTWEDSLKTLRLKENMATKTKTLVNTRNITTTRIRNIQKERDIDGKFQ